MNPQEGDSSGTSPHLSIELLEKLLPSFLQATENRQGSRELPLFPTPNLPPRETFDGVFGSNVPLSSFHGGTSQNPSTYVDLSLRLGPPNQGAVRSPAMNSCNIFAARNAMRMQGMHGQNKRGFPDYGFGEHHVGNMGQLALLAKRRATESQISASNNLNASPPFSQMQQLFNRTAPTSPVQALTVGEGGVRDKGKAIESSSSSSSSHYRPIGLPAQAYMQERLQHRPIGYSPSFYDLTHGPPPVTPGIPMMPKLCPFLFEQKLDNENTQNAQNENAQLQADTLLSDSESEEEEEETDEEDQEDDDQDGQTEDLLDDEGKYIIEPVGNGWSPAHRAHDAINYVIQTQFRGVFHSYGIIPLADRQQWFRVFKEKCTWDARHEQHIQMRFEAHCSKHLGDILSQVRNTRKKPQWMKVEDWIELLAYWDTPSFKNISARNQANRTPNRGITVNTGGYQDFTDVAKDLAKKFGRDPYPDEFFLATNKYNYPGHWMDSCAAKTYEEYQLRLLKRQSQVGEASSSRVTQETRVDILSEVAKGKTSGHVYGIADKAVNVPTKASSLTQESGAPPSPSEASEEIDKAHQ
ncbi:uncharacterized protein LOC114174917 [Vigna unguiculata]|uniref:uncharacterized protein LOC114174917 n=1 Tax=Vigna unguiculata TaxID=3917 RepID=UPI001016FC0A|nr:uncharacterized protein LOC114174917 [Vigna unguiculata]